MGDEQKMMNEKPRIVFMGTPEFAVASLDALVTAGHTIVGVITAPDKPAGRGMKLTSSAVKKYATDKGLPVLQPEKLKNPEFIDELKKLNADMQVVVAFRMLPEVVWNMPRMGTINVHASLLPNYRGAAPINWAIINGEKETGVTTFKLTHEIDTGNILMQQRVGIHEEDTAGDLHDKLKDAGAKLLIRTIEGLLLGDLKEKPQDTFLNEAGIVPVTHAPKLNTETCRIRWNAPVRTIHNLVRGLSPFPGAFTEFEHKTLKIFRSEARQGTPLNPGSYDTDHKEYLRFSANDGYLYIKELQLEGRKRMEIREFLKGYRFNKPNHS